MTVEKEIFIARHAETPANVGTVFQGDDEPLSTTGERQAKVLAERFAKLKLDALVSGTQRRAVHTANEISLTSNLPVQRSRLFLERRKPSALVGKPFADPEANELWQRWQRSLYMPDYRVEDGENYDEILQRVHDAMLFLRRLPAKKVGVVSSGFFTRTFIGVVLLGSVMNGATLREICSNFTMNNTGISALRYQVRNGRAGWHLVTHNDHAHLG